MKNIKVGLRLNSTFEYAMLIFDFSKLLADIINLT